MRSIHSWLWRKDPGFFRLKHASKTVLSICITVALLAHTTLIVRLCAGMAAGFSTLGVEGERWQVKLTSLAIADTGFFFAYLIGSLAKPYPLASSLFLIVLSFSVMYVRRFGARYTVFPLFVWVFGFLGTLLPRGTPIQMVHVSLGMLLGFIVSGSVYLLIYSSNKQTSFYDNLLQFFKECAHTSDWLIHELNQPKPNEQLSETVKAHKNSILQILLLNEAITQVQAGRSQKMRDCLLNIYVAQFALLKAMSILLEAVVQIRLKHYTLPETMQTSLINLLKALTHIFDTIHSNPRTGITLPTNIKNCTNELNQFKQALAHCRPDQNKEAVWLINVHLGLRLMLKNLQLMEQPS